MSTTVKQSQTRKDVIKGPDAFMSAATDTATWVQEHRKPVILGLISLGVAVLVFWGTLIYIEHYTNDSSSLYFAAIKAENGYFKDPADTSTDTPVLPAGTLIFTTKDEQNQAIEKSWQEVISQYGNAKLGQLARFRLAGILAGNGKTKEALALYNEFIAKAPTDESLIFVARERIGYLYEADKDFQKALDVFGQLVGGSQNIYQDAGYFHQARMYVQLGNKSRAKELFERVSKEFPDSDFKKSAETYLAQLGPVGTNEGGQTPSGQGLNPEMPQ